MAKRAKKKVPLRKNKSNHSSNRRKKKSKASKRLSINTLLIGVALLSLGVCLIIKEYPHWSNYSAAPDANAYIAFKNAVGDQQQEMHKNWSIHTPDGALILHTAEDFVYHCLVDSVFAYWYGTPWDFNGTTRTPGKGMIACGYFVTTTLEDIGFRLERRLLAQQAASIIINTLCTKSSIRSFNKIKLLKKFMDMQQNGIYILGLDTHVGFLIKSIEGLHIVHSSYSGNRQVSKEAWDKSTVMSRSKMFMVGSMTGNKALFQKWIASEKIPLQR